MKHCSRCKQTLASSAFGACSAAADGKQAWCKPCKLDAKRDTRDKNRDWHAFVEKSWQSHQLHYKMPGEFGSSADLRLLIWKRGDHLFQDEPVAPVEPHPGLHNLYQASMPQMQQLGILSAFCSEAELTGNM